MALATVGACWMYPHPACSAQWAQGIPNFRASAVKKHLRSGPPHFAMAMWVSGGQMTSALGSLPPHVRTGVLTAFWAVYQSEKRGGSLSNFPRDLSRIELSSGDVLPGYNLRFFARVILRAHSGAFPQCPWHHHLGL